MKKLKLIVNPKAGNGKALEVAFKIESLLEKKKALYSLDSTYRSKGATLLAKKAVSLGFDIIGVIGGDGTVNEVINGLIGSDLPIVIIPAGSKNSLASSLNIPSDPEAACQAFFWGQEHHAALGKINGHYFIHKIRLGLKNTSFLSRLKHKPQPVNLKLGDGKSIDTQLLLLSATPEDGLLEVSLFTSPTKLKLLTGKVPAPAKLQTREFWIDSPAPLSVKVDGETIPDKRPYHVLISSKKQTILTAKA